MGELLVWLPLEWFQYHWFRPETALPCGSLENLISNIGPNSVGLELGVSNRKSHLLGSSFCVQFAKKLEVDK